MEKAALRLSWVSPAGPALSSGVGNVDCLVDGRAQASEIESILAWADRHDLSASGPMHSALQGRSNPLDKENRYLKLPVAFLPSKGNGSRANNYGEPLWHGIFDMPTRGLGITSCWDHVSSS